jgi:hypothetical protein
VLRSGDEPVTTGLEALTSVKGASGAEEPDETGTAAAGVDDAAGTVPADAGALIAAEAGDAEDAPAAAVLAPAFEPLLDEPEPLLVDPELPEDPAPLLSLPPSWLEPLCSSGGLPPPEALSSNSRACPGARSRACWAAVGQFSWVLGSRPVAVVPDPCVTAA